MPPGTANLAHDGILRRIAAGEPREGEKIVPLALARGLGVSPRPIREALSRPSAERAATQEPNRGFRVAPAPGPDGVVDLALVSDRIRRRSCGPRFEDSSRFILDDARSRATLAGLPGNPLVQEIHGRPGCHPRIPRRMHGTGIVDAARIVGEHDAIVAALRGRDRDGARTALRAHIVDA